MKETFILKRSYGSVFNELSDKQAGVLIKAVFEYIATGGIPAGLNDGEIKMALKFICQDIESFNQSYQNRCETNRRNGGMGGAPRGNQNAKKKEVAEAEKTTETTETTEWLKNNPNDNDCDNDNDIPPLTPPKGVVEEDENFDFSSLEIPDDGCNRNFSGLLRNLEMYHFSVREKKQVIALTNYGEIGHPVWNLLLFEAKQPGIKMPRLFILKRLGLQIK
jgi:hypothetical protein